MASRDTIILLIVVTKKFLSHSILNLVNLVILCDVVFSMRLNSQSESQKRWYSLRGRGDR